MFLICVTLCNKWSTDDNHVITGLVSILLTRILGDDRFHLLWHIKRPKGKAYVWNLGVNENRSYLPLKLVRTTACSKYTNRRCISHNRLKSLCLVMWLFTMIFQATGFVSSLMYLFVISYNKQQTHWLQPSRVSMLLPFVMHTMITIIPLLFV